MLYLFTARNSKDELYEGELEAQSKLEVFEKVRKDGGKILSVKEKGSKKTLSFQVFGGKVNMKDKIIFARNLSSMLTAGLPVTRALSVMEKQTKKKALHSVLESLRMGVEKGEPLSSALQKQDKTFPPIFIAMVRAGEESGNLSQSLHTVALQMEKAHELTSRVRGALIYPSVILSLMVVISILLLVFMVPTLTETFKGLNIELPRSTQVIISASEFLISHTLIVLSVLFVMTLISISLFKSALGQNIFDRVLLKLPAIKNIVREVNSARTARTLSSLLSAGVPIVNSIVVTQEVLGNHFYQNALKEAATAVEKGEILSHIFEKYENIYPAFMAEMAAVGEETGKMSEMFLNLAVYYEGEVDQKTKNLSTIIEPVLMILIGIVVAIFALSMLAPTYSLVEYI